ncbi:MAG: hypothetical protein ACOCTR_01630 [Candidatus Natronoplasma sp.]
MNILQWLQSKIVLIAVVIILVSSVTGFFYHQMDQFEQEELENRARKLSQIITDMENTDADEMVQRITFHEDNEGIYLPPEVGGDPYTVQITKGYVRLKQDGRDTVEGLGADVHLWGPGGMNESGTLGKDEMEWRDEMNPELELEAGERDLRLIMLRLNDGARYENHIFITREGTD